MYKRQDQKRGKVPHWNFKRLSSRENPLVLFTLAAQAAAGAFALQFGGALAGIAGFTAFAESPLYAPLAIVNFMLVAFGLFMSTMHLGKPHRFYRGFNNLRHSPVSREGLGIAIFIGGLGLHILASLPGNAWFRALWQAVFGVDIAALAGTSFVRALAMGSGVLALLGAAAGLYYMNRCYRIKARPFWNHWQVATAFGGSVLSLGSLLAGAVVLGTLAALDVPRDTVALVFGALLTAGLAIEGIGHVAHAKAMGTAAHEGGASYYIQSTTFGKTYTLRNTLLGANLLLAACLLTVLAVDGASPYTLAGWALVGVVTLFTSLIGRALFYVLVIPTTMPGAFFWKNKGFEDHARQIGLARMPQVGVAPLRH